ncbi:MAG: HYR domain-containing protein, partial [Myxococcaceae bacterium]|nr:HYR domain-containing protein [Myxococcaceae bacterium]
MRARFPVVALLAVAGLAATPRLIADLNPTPGASGFPYPELTVGNVGLFTMFDPVHGNELWTTNGADAGLLADVFPGSASSSPNDFALAGGKVFFTANHENATGDGTVGLFTTDGATVTFVADLPGGSRYPHDLTPLGSQVIFWAFQDATGDEPWVSDGTAGGTHLLLDLTPGPDDTRLGAATAVGDRVYFSVSSQNLTLYRTDGTAAGTGPISGPLTFCFPGLAAGQVFLSNCLDALSNGATYRFDATDGGPLKVGDPRLNGAGAALGTATVLSMTTATEGDEPYLYEPADGGLRLLGDLNPGVTGSAPYGFTAVGNQVFFFATSLNGTELWATDGSDAGTRVVKSIGASAASTYFDAPAALGSRFFFSVSDGVSGIEPWISDGTAAGTVQLADLNPGAGNSSPSRPLAVGNTLVFQAITPTTGIELFRTDGTPQGTRLLADLVQGTLSSFPQGFAELDGGTYFVAQDPGVGAGALFRTDGTTAGTVRAVVLRADAGSNEGVLSSTFPPTPLNGRLLLNGTDGKSGNELFRTDGTQAGTEILRDIGPFQSGSFARGPVVVGSSLYFTAFDGAHGFELWKTDGSDAGTVLFDLNPAGGGGSAPSQVVPFAGAVYFAATVPGVGSELFRSDGTDAGTGLFLDLRPGAAGSAPSSFAVAGNVLVFSADDGVHGRELWATDGVDAGMLVDLEPDGGSNPSQLVTVGTTVYFSATTAGQGTELWATNGTASGTRLISLRTGAGSSAPRSLVSAGGRLVFVANNGVHGFEPWVSNGTTAGTFQLKDIAPGVASSYPVILGQVGNRIFFAADDRQTGLELWSTDTTFGSPTLFADLAPGPASSNPGKPVVAGSTLVVSAQGSGLDTELYELIDVSAPPMIAAVVSPPPNDAGWNTTATTVSFTITSTAGPILRVQGCDGGTVTQDAINVPFACVATSAGGTAQKLVIVNKDSVAPNLTCPAPITVAADGGSTTAVSYSATVSDALDPIPTVTFTPPSGSAFPGGTTSVAVAARDGAGNLATCSFDVTVTGASSGSGGGTGAAGGGASSAGGGSTASGG